MNATARFIVGDTLEVLRTLPTASVDLVCSSPPFLSVRSYLPTNHPDKAKEMGSERTPGEFIDALLDVTEECVPAGTLVATPQGSRPIEDVCRGDVVFGVDHETSSVVLATVTDAMSNDYQGPLVSVGHTRMTPSHPVWTDQFGYVLAGSLGYEHPVVYDGAHASPDTSQPCVRTVRCLVSDGKTSPTVLRTDLLVIGTMDTRTAAAAGGDHARLGTTGGRSCGEVGSVAVTGQPTPPTRSPRTLHRHSTGERVWMVERRQWSAPVHGTGRVGSASWLANGAGRSDGAGRSGLAYSLQARLGSSDAEGQRRSGWPIASDGRGSTRRRKTGRLLAVSGLGRHSGDKQPSGCRPPLGGDAGSQRVYNLTTSTGNYFAGSLLVHNCRRVLTPHGSLCFELGDTMAGSGGAGGDYAPDGMREGQPRFDGSSSKAYGTGAAPRPARHRSIGPDPIYAQRGEQSQGTGAGGAWPLDKSHCLVPELFRIALAYGVNPLTGRQTPRWRVRNVIRWHRPNPAVGALSDAVRRSTTDIVVACTSRKRYFDLDSCRIASSPNTHARTARGVESRVSTGKTADDEGRGGNFSTLDTLHSTNGAPLLDTWVVPTAQFHGAHFATWPKEIARRLIELMCPRRVCTTCGAPSRRLVTPRPGSGYEVMLGRDLYGVRDRGERDASGRNHAAGTTQFRGTADNVTTGWSECSCPGEDRWRPGVVLDPFAGTGTTLSVAHGHGRSSIGIDLNPANVDLARGRLGMFLEEPT